MALTARFDRTREMFTGKAREVFARKTRAPTLVLAWLKTPIPTGWAVFISGLLAAWIAAQWGWVEAYLIATICVVVLLLALALVIWPTPHQITIDLPKERIAAGQSAVGAITVTNTRNRPASSGVIKLSIGNGVGHFLVPLLGPRGEWNEMFSAITRRRGLISIGPVRSVCLDGLGLLRRVHIWDRPDILRVHPRTLRLSFGAAGFQMDVEGMATAKLSSSDVSFHALRDYEPDDDRRNAHWVSTARPGCLIVHQFEGTRRPHHMIILDTAAHSWSSEAFETAISAGTSLTLVVLGASRAVPTSTSSGWVSTTSPVRILDALTEVRAQDTVDTQDRVRRYIEERARVSAVTTIVNPNVSDGQTSRVVRLMGADVSTLVIRICPGASRRRRKLAWGMLLDCPSLDDLPRLTARGAIE